MKILAIIPTQTELDFFLQACQSHGYQAQVARIGKLTTTYFPALEIVVAHGGLGKTQFAVQTQHLIDMAHWDLVICAGAAGALVNDLSIGDVVIATESVEHDIKNKFGRPLLPRFDGAENILKLCRQTLQSELAFHVHFGPIASGDEDVVESERRESIQMQTGALAVAWEGAGGARAAQFSGVPYIEIRGVTDSANSTAVRDFELNVKKAMQNVAHVIISLALRSANGTGRANNGMQRPPQRIPHKRRGTGGGNAYSHRFLKGYLPYEYDVASASR